MRCVFDPNVLVAALLSQKGTPAVLIRLWLDGAFELVVSELLLAELQRVLAYPKIRTRIGEADAEAFLILLRENATLMDDPAQPPSLRTADPHDDYLIALAQAARTVIVSGDKHLLDMAEELPVYAPADFRNLISSRGF